MKVIAWIQKFYIAIPVATVIGFVVIGAIWGSYVLLLKNKELTTQDILHREVQELRAERTRLTERTHELEQQLAVFQKNPGEAQKGPATEDVKVELKKSKPTQFCVHGQKGRYDLDIAAKYNVAVNDLMRWNKLTPRSRIFPGDQLTIILKE